MLSRSNKRPESIFFRILLKKLSKIKYEICSLVNLVSVHLKDQRLAGGYPVGLEPHAFYVRKKSLNLGTL